jgi:hypothetical protein
MSIATNPSDIAVNKNQRSITPSNIAFLPISGNYLLADRGDM